MSQVGTGALPLPLQFLLVICAGWVNRAQRT
jgi:hypothetical protein